MMRTPPRTTFANVTSVVALMVALATGAYATHEDIRSSDIEDGTIQSADIARATGHIYSGGRTMEGAHPLIPTKALTSIPGVARIKLVCSDPNKGDAGDTVGFRILNMSGGLLRITNLLSNKFDTVDAGEESAVTLGDAYKANHIFQMSRPGSKAPIATVIASGEALTGSNKCYGMAQALASKT